MEPSAAQSSAHKKRKTSYSTFDEDDFVDKIMDKKKNRVMCCGKSCILHMTEANVRAHAMLLSFYSTIDPPDLRNRVYRSFVMSCYMICVDQNGKHSQYRVPAIGRSLCRDTWLMFMNISKSTYTAWRSLTISTRNVLPVNHGLIANSSNSGKPAAKAAVRRFIKDVAESDGHPLPVCARASDRAKFEYDEEIESIVFLPPKYSKRGLHEEYNAIQTDTSMRVAWSTFENIVDQDLPFIRISLRTRGLCDICFVFRDRVKKVSDQNLTAHAQEWRLHLELAETTRQIYRKSLSNAQSSAKYLLPLRLKAATISYDYAKQLSIPLVSAQTTNEWFAQKKGYDVNLFGIVDEGSGTNGIQYNYIYGEGTKHGSIQVVSMLHHFFSNTSQAIGHPEKLFLHSDSCVGQNKNNIVLGYYMLRVALGYHEEVVWQFMTVGHTKFRPDEGFGQIRCFVDGRADILCMEEMKEAIELSAFSNHCIHFPVEDVRNWKEVSEIFNPLVGIRKTFAYKIHIRACNKFGKRTVCVEVYHEPGKEEPDQSLYLAKEGKDFPSLNSFTKILPTKLTEARRAGLRKDVYSVLAQNRTHTGGGLKMF